LIKPDRIEELVEKGEEKKKEKSIRMAMIVELKRSSVSATLCVERTFRSCRPPQGPQHKCVTEDKK